MFWAYGKLHEERDLTITKKAPASAVACVWYYEKKKADLDDSATAFYIRHGRPVIGVPALACSPNTTILPSRYNLNNIRRFAAIIHKHKKHPEARGLINSVWLNTYYLPGTLSYGLAYGADRFNRPVGTRGFPKLFAKTFFGLPMTSPAGNLLRDLHDCAPRFRDLHNLIERACHEDLRAVTPKERRAAIQMGRKVEKIAAQLRQVRPAVIRNRDIYDTYILAADILIHIGDRAAILAQAEAGRAALRKLAHRARVFADAAWRNWDTAYDPAHPCREMRFPPKSQTPQQCNIDRYCYFGAAGKHSNKHIFSSLEKSANFLQTLAKTSKQSR
ncbi:MAG: hypothetical protein ABR497_12800 [Kiritimatiellia bacterium]